MAKATGYAALAALTTFTAKKWFTKSFVTLVGDISRLYGKRNEVQNGLLFSHAGGTVNATSAALDMTAGTVTVDGAMADFAALNDTNVLAVAGNFLGPIYSDGVANTARALTLTTDKKVYISVILINSTGAGAVGTAPKFICVISGAAAAGAATGAFLTTTEINAALASSAGNATNYDHSGGASADCSWVHVARFIHADASSSLSATVSDNRNNIAGV